MTRTAAQEKGDALENAVRMIETVILGADPYAIDSPIKIERKKIIKVQGVRHEIDIYITANIGKGYTSTFIFECKNWQDKIDKNEIIVFARKIKDVRASKGYFVARRFTKDAKAQADRDGVELLEADDAINVFHPFLDGLPFLNHSFLETEVKIRVMTPGPDNEDFLWGFQRESFVKYMSEDLLLRDLVEGIRWGIASEEVSKLSSQEIAAFGKEPRYYEKTRIFGYQSGELFVEGTECSAIEIRLKWG